MKHILLPLTLAASLGFAGIASAAATTGMPPSETAANLAASAENHAAAALPEDNTALAPVPAGASTTSATC